MIDPPQIVQTAEQLTAIIHLTVPRHDIQNVMGPGLDEVRSAIAAQGIQSTGPWFTHHLKMDPEIFDFEICIPVDSPVESVGRVRPSRWPAMKVVRTVYHGGFEGLGAAWGDFGDWIKAQGYTPAVDLWERYLSCPELNPDPSTWQTELNRPLAG